MNTTPDFDRIGQLVPMESQAKLKNLARMRLGCVAIAVYVCAFQMMGVGVWSAGVDRLVILAGVLIGLGLYGDSVEQVWHGLGAWGKRGLVALCAIVVLGNIIAPQAPAWFLSGMPLLCVFLATMAFGLRHMLTAPLRAGRYRQMQRYLRSLPKADRPGARDRMYQNFRTLVAEGFG